MIYKDENMNALARHLRCIEDHRDDRGKLHRLIDIFILTIFGSLWGHTDFTNMAADLKYQEGFFTDLLGLRNGIPSHDTFSAVFSVVAPGEFLECFLNWMAGVVRTNGMQVAIDGKAIRAACEKVHSKQVPYMVNAYMVGLGLSIGQIRIDEKTNEIKGIPEMLEWLDLKGATVTIDAIGCQKEIARLLIGKGADFVFQVKENQPALHRDVRLEMQAKIEEKRFTDARDRLRREKGVSIGEPSGPVLDVYQQLEHDHSRIDRRTYYALNDNACVDGEEWPDIKAIGAVYRERLVIKRDTEGEIIDGEPSKEWSFHVMSKAMGAEEFAVYVRGHWGIENSLHWVLDDFFREDRCTARAGHATENLALMRKIVFNLMSLDDSVIGMSAKAKQVYYRNHPGAIQKLVFEDIPSKY